MGTGEGVRGLRLQATQGGVGSQTCRHVGVSSYLSYYLKLLKHLT